MRIGMLCDMYKPHTSGVTHHVALTKAALEALGHEVWVFTFGNLDHADEEACVVRSSGVPYGRTGYNFGLGYTREAAALLRTMDVLHVHHPFMSGRFALKLRRACAIPVVFTNHTRYDIYAGLYAGFVPKALSRWYVATFLKRFCRSVDAVIAPSEGLAGILRSFGVDSSIDVVPNGIDLTPFHGAVARSRAEFGLSADDVALCYLGRLGPEKRTMWLLGCFGAIAKRHPEAALVFVGDGPERERLERTVRSGRLQGRVVFAGPTPYDDVPSWLAACDVGVTASVSEVHPLTLIESMAAGLPCVGIVSPGIADTIEHEVTGLLSEDDPVRFAEAIERVIADASLRVRLGRAARDGSSAYDIARTVEQLEAVYERVVQAAGKSR